MASIGTRTAVAGGTTFSILAAVSFGHMLNDIMQTLLTSIYPLLKENYSLSFVQVGLLTFAFQITASFLQPVVGVVTDRRPLPYSLAVGMLSTCTGILTLAFAHGFTTLVLGACFIGIGSAIFHPESSRVARMASGGRHGLAQSLFQVGGNTGQAIGPLLAALIVIPLGQQSLKWFAALALIGFATLSWVGTWYSRRQRNPASRVTATVASGYSRRKVLMTLLVLVTLVATKNAYAASISSYYTFYTIEKYGLDMQQAQYLLFLFMAASAAGVFFGGPIGDRFGQITVIWFSILGVIPFALLLPYANMVWSAVLVIVIGFVFSSAFSAIVVYGQELVPGHVGLIAGMFFGFSFGFGGIGAAVLGLYADRLGIEAVYRICSYLPLLGLLTVLLPSQPGGGSSARQPRVTPRGRLARG